MLQNMAGHLGKDWVLVALISENQSKRSNDLVVLDQDTWESHEACIHRFVSRYQLKLVWKT